MYLSSAPSAEGPIDVADTLNQLVRSVETQTAAVVSNTGYLSRGAAREWATNLANRAKFLRKTLLAARPEDPRPFFERKPEVAVKLVREGKKDLLAEVRFFREASADVAAINSMDSLLAVLERLFAQILQVLEKGLMKVAASAVKNAPFLTALVVGGVGLYAFTLLRGLRR